jgi:hypothetical protein
MTDEFHELTRARLLAKEEARFKLRIEERAQALGGEHRRSAYETERTATYKRPSILFDNVSLTERIAWMCCWEVIKRMIKGCWASRNIRDHGTSKQSMNPSFFACASIGRNIARSRARNSCEISPRLSWLGSGASPSACSNVRRLRSASGSSDSFSPTVN